MKRNRSIENENIEIDRVHGLEIDVPIDSWGGFMYQSILQQQQYGGKFC